MLKARLAALIAAILLLFALPAAVLAGGDAPASPADPAAERLGVILSELIKAGVHYSSYSVRPDEGSILIIVEQEDFTLAETVISSLECMNEEPRIPVFLGVSNGENAVEVTPSPASAKGKKGAFPILALVFGAAGVAVFFMKRRSTRRSLIRAQYQG